MFLPDKPKAFSEARRGLRPKGLYVFNVWDRIEENEFADSVTLALAARFASDPPSAEAFRMHEIETCDAKTKALLAALDT